ncbi:hypothetical protein CDAR_537801 [Caerostris darwini]|uniref:Uncharacterized protein n=1 Tax=Caerostris darwini TaxID=1538125 RepID=A0AAV4RT59_9ARAC|nr:hypothetical protein CDAR_537801 [Caerostris darwini]
MLRRVGICRLYAGELACANMNIIICDTRECYVQKNARGISEKERRGSEHEMPAHGYCANAVCVVCAVITVEYQREERTCGSQHTRIHVWICAEQCE